jgi:hypothetical protein
LTARAAARSVNAAMTATYWEIGRRVVEYEQGGKARAGYGEALVERLARDLDPATWPRPPDTTAGTDAAWWVNGTFAASAVLIEP